MLMGPSGDVAIGGETTKIKKLALAETGEYTLTWRNDGAAGDALSGEIVISGSSTVEPISVAVAESYRDVQPDVNVSVSGPGTGDGFKLAVRGKTFSASMIVTSSPCKQSINIFPSGLDVSRIAIGLKKC